MDDRRGLNSVGFVRRYPRIWGFNTKAKLARVKAPVLIVHGDEDEVIAYEFGQELFRVAPEPKTFWTIGGATHNDLHLVGGAEFPSRLRSFYSTLR